MKWRPQPDFPRLRSGQVHRCCPAEKTGSPRPGWQKKEKARYWNPGLKKYIGVPRIYLVWTFLATCQVPDIRTNYL